MHAFHNHFIRHPEVDGERERDSENENDDFIKSQRSRNERSKNTNYIVHFRQPSFTQEPPLLLSAIDEDHEIFFKLLDNDNNNHDQKDYYEYDGCDNNQNRINTKNFNVIYPITIYLVMILTIVLSATLANQKGIESIPTQIIPIIPTTKSIIQKDFSRSTTTSTVTDPHRYQQQQQQHQEQQQRQNHDFNIGNNNAFLIPPTTMMTAMMTAKTIDKRTIQHNNNNDNNFDRNKRIGNNDDEDNSNEQIIADVTRKFLREHSPPSFEM